MKKQAIIFGSLFVVIVAAAFFIKDNSPFIEHRVSLNDSQSLILADYYKELEGDIAFATNAGMFHDDGSTVGLYIENGEEKYPINIEDGEGNFFLKPNGVFWFGDGEAGVEDTETYLENSRNPEFATQSGPMLVTNGQINPAFNVESDNLNIRSGVCVQDNEALFILSTEDVSFYALAEQFLDVGCMNALYLDGYISDFWINGKEQIEGRDENYRTFFVEYEN
jgi:uncharacterized protein YigE (DUF2233 family)